MVRYTYFIIAYICVYIYIIISVFIYDAGSLPENHVSDEIANSFNLLED